jgi:hypothetical protein
VTATTGNAKIETINGTITVDNAVRAGQNVLLNSGGAGSDVELNAAVTSDTRSITVQAQDSVNQFANGNITVTAGTGSIYVRAVDGSITMTDGVTSTTANGNVVYRADDNVTVGLINAGTGRVGILATNGSILDARTDTVGVDANGFAMQTGSTRTVNIIASELSMAAGDDIGTAGNAIDTTVGTLTATAGSDVYLYQSGLPLTIGSVGAFSVNLIGLDSSTTVLTTALATAAPTPTTILSLVQSGVTATTGHAKIETFDGTITVDRAVTAGQDILLAARGATSDLIIDSNITSNTGHITLTAGDDIDLNANLRTDGNLAASGTVYLIARNQTPQNQTSEVISGIDMQDGTFIQSQGGNIRLVADNEGDIRLSEVNADTGNVSLVAERSILDSNGTALNVRANNLRMVADAVVTPDGLHNLAAAGNQTGTIGESDAANGTPNTNARAIDTRVNTLSARSADGIYISQSGNLTIADTGLIQVQRVHLNSTTISRDDASLSDLTTTDNGVIKIQLTTGTIVLTDGADADGIAVSANGSGDVLIQTLANNGDLNVNSSIVSGSGNITLDAADDIDLNAVITTRGVLPAAGSVLLNAENRTVADVAADLTRSGEADGVNIDAVITTSEGNILVNSERDIRQTAMIQSTGGSVGLVAERDIIQTNTGDITISTGDILIAADRDWTMGAQTELTTGGSEFLGRATRDITLGVISLSNATLNRAALEAGRDIIDANAGAVNIQETNPAAPNMVTSLSLRAGGRIGNADAASSSPRDNVNAIDINVDRVAAQAATGIYLREVDGGGNLVVRDVSAFDVLVNVERVNFNSTTQTESPETGATAPPTGGLAALSDLTTTNGGVIKVVVENGTLIVNDGADGDGLGVTAQGGGDILLDVREVGAATVADVRLNTDVVSGSGHVTITAADSIVSADDIRTAGSGDVVIESFTGSISLNDADSDGRGISVANGDVLVRSATRITIDADIRSTAGDIALIATGDVLQNADVHAGGDLIVSSQSDIVMDNNATTRADGGELIYRAVGDINLGLVEATNVNLDAGADINDSRNGFLANVIATNLAMRAGSEIGDESPSDTARENSRAIDTQVSNLAAQAADGIYVQELASGQGLTVRDVADISVTVNITRANFDSTRSDSSSTPPFTATGVATPTFSATGLADLTTTGNGSIKIVVQNGTLIVRDGEGTGPRSENGIGVSAGGSGDVLLEARGVASNVIIATNADIISGTGHVSVMAGDDIDLMADVRTGGGGTVFFVASNGTEDVVTGIEMANGTSITTANGNVRLVADNESDIRLARITTSADVSLVAERSILDNNGDQVNVEADTLRMLADAVVNATDFNGSAVGGNGTGFIGGSDSANGDFANNANAIDTRVRILAAQSAEGIYVEEANGLIVDATGDITVRQVNFNSTLTPLTGAAARTDASLADLTTTNNGSIKIVTRDGMLLIRDGAANAIHGNDGVGVNANSTIDPAAIPSRGSVLLQAEGMAADVVLNAIVRTSNNSGDAGVGHITISAADDIDMNADVLTGSVGAVRGTVYLIAGNNNSVGRTGIDMQSGTSITTGGGNVRLVADNESDIRLSEITTGRGDVSLIAERSILDNNDGANPVLNISARNLRMVADATVEVVAGVETITESGDGTGIIGGAETGNGSPGRNLSAIDTSVDLLAARSAEGIYVQEADVITIGSTGDLRVQQVNFNSTLTMRQDASLSDLVTTTNGSVKVVATGGSITVTDGTMGSIGGANGLGVVANGSGSILLETRGSNGDVVVQASLRSDSGHITLNAGRDVDINATLTTSGTGTVYLKAAQDILSDSVITTFDGDVLSVAGRDIRQTAAINSTAGDVGLLAGRNVTQAANGDITTATGDVLVKATTGNWTMSRNAVITVGGAAGEAADVLGIAGRDILLGMIRLTNATENRVALQAIAGSITDANGAVVNIEETVETAQSSLSLRAGTIIGGAGGTASSTNDQAIDLNIDTVAATAASGIYLREVAAGKAIVIDTAAGVTVDIDGVRKAEFNSTTSDASRGDSLGALQDLTTSNDGPIKLVAESGSITINPGTAGTGGVNADGSGDVLLESRGAESDIVINAAIRSETGHITFNSDRHVDINSTVTTGGDGTVYVNATQQIDSDAVITTVSGDILLESDSGDINQTALITSRDGDIGLVAQQNITQSLTGDISTSKGNVLIKATTGNWTMDGGATITAGGVTGDMAKVVGIAGQNIELGVIRLTNVKENRVALEAKAGSITDANGTAINIEETVAVANTSLSLRAATIIGGTDASSSSENDQALDLSIDTIAAKAASGIYLQEVANGGAIMIDTVASVAVNINGVVRADFDSGTTRVPQGASIAALEDLTTSDNGPIKLVAKGGSITVNPGSTNVSGVSANGSGDVLLEARGTASDIVINAAVLSGSGHITLNAGDDIDLNANVQTASSGTVYLLSSNRQNDNVRGIDMQAGTSIITGGGNVRLVADNEGDILLSRISAGSGNASLIAERSILDNNGGTVNVEADALRMVADANVSAEGSVVGLTEDQTGTIGRASNLLETSVSSLAAQSASGVFITESNTLVTGTIADISVQQVNFSSLVSERRDLSLGGVTTENGSGEIRIHVESGSLTVNEGTETVDGAGSAVATGILAKGDRSLIHLTATDDIFVNSSVIASLDGKTTLDNADADLDGDKILDQVDHDLDGDGIDNRTDTDDDGDGQLDAVDLTPLGEGKSSGEVITITSATGNISFSNGVIVSTDEDWSPWQQNSTPESAINDTTSDRIIVVADADKTGLNGVVRFGQDVTLRSDGGVARSWSLRPLPSRNDGTAFFEFGPRQVDDRIAGEISNQRDFYQGVFTVVIGVAGEENLRLDIDWRDAFDGNVAPERVSEFNGGRFDVTSDRYQLIRLTEGSQAYDFSHRWTLQEVGKMMNDLKDDFPNREIVLDFSVSHHESLNVQGNAVEQGGATPVNEAIPGRQISSTDVVTDTQNPLTGLLPENLGDKNIELQFENGVAFFTVPAPAPKGILAQTVEPLPIPAQVLVRDQQAIITNPVVAEEQGYAATGQVTGTEVYFRMMRTLPDGTEVPIGSDIKSEVFSSPDALDALIRSNNLPDGTGYEVKLILETGGKTIERSVLEFDITGGQPQVTGSGDVDLDEMKLERRPDFRLEPNPDQEEQPADNGSANAGSPADPIVGSSDVIVDELIEGGEGSPVGSGKSVPVIAPVLEVPGQGSESGEESITLKESAVSGSVAFGMITSLQLAKSRRRQRESEFGMSKAARLSRRLSGLMGESQDEDKA